METFSLFTLYGVTVNFGQHMVDVGVMKRAGKKTESKTELTIRFMTYHRAWVSVIYHTGTDINGFYSLQTPYFED